MKAILNERTAIEAADWFAKKKFCVENGRNTYRTQILCVFGETEKALHVFLGSLHDSIITWIPKACVKEAEEGTTYECSDFAEAVETVKYLRDMYD